MKRNMKVKNIFIYTFIAPLMIVAAILGFTFRADSKKNFYLPLGTVGFFMILDRGFNRILSRKNIVKKIQSFKNNK
tara:strand:+ start:276 stop:503 length:228 start_codon:yes stop_codon:yes gene_type:complete